MAPASERVPAKQLPTAEEVIAAEKIQLSDNKGNKVTFGEVIAEKKTIVVFIRHFFCGTCQAYVAQLESGRKEAEKAGISTVVIGCGQPEAIQQYIDVTEFKGPIYANPDRELYHAFGMNIEYLGTTPSGETPKSYVPGQFGNIIRSTARTITHITLLGKQGNISQLGGDFIFGPGNTCSFAYRMQHTEDHLEVRDLLIEAGVPVSKEWKP